MRDGIVFPLPKSITSFTPYILVAFKVLKHLPGIPFFNAWFRYPLFIQSTGIPKLSFQKFQSETHEPVDGGKAHKQKSFASSA